MSLGNWSDTLPLDDLPGQIAFYRKLATRRPEVYGPDAAALERFAAEIAP